MATLIVTLPPNPADPAAQYPYGLSRDGSTVDAHSCVTLDQLPKKGNTDVGVLQEVVAVVPARQLSWHQVQLPKGTLGNRLIQQDGGANRLRSLLEGLLEDQLLDDVAQMHFALEPSPAKDAPVWVAVCDRSWLRASLDALQTVGLKPTRVVPQFAPGSLGDTLYMHGDADDAQMVCTCREGVSAWPVSAASVALLNWPASADVVAEPAVAHLAEQYLHRPARLQHAMQHYLQALQSPWDLAQLSLLGSGRARSWMRWTQAWTSLLSAPRWRAARWFVCAILAFNVLGLNALAWKERSRMNEQRAAMQSILRSTFAHVQVVVDAPTQMAREMASLAQANGVVSGNDLEALLDALGGVASEDTSPVAVDFVAGELRMRGLRLSPQAIAQLALQLQANGFSAQMDGDSLLIKEVPAR